MFYRIFFNACHRAKYNKRYIATTRQKCLDSDPVKVMNNLLVTGVVLKRLVTVR